MKKRRKSISLKYQRGPPRSPSIPVPQANPKNTNDFPVLFFFAFSLSMCVLFLFF
ncbi:hypothetical protein BC940DRAFT_7984 [Gongronella butleri]|nr:hypothetical protein BC940DRAFT_7984 [Gongronella butleri]